ncbi:MAG: hypothetical protein ABI156_02215 [Caldimonas sp.]
MKTSTHWTVYTASGDLTEGLFGQIVLYLLEVLPYLDHRSIVPSWDVRSRLYGQGPEYTVIPGIFDAAEAPTVGGDAVGDRRNLMVLHALHGVALGDDWAYMQRLWTKYFRVPARVQAAAAAVPLPARALGLHYRGTDKSAASWDTNPVSQDDFLILVDDFLKRHTQVDGIFIATDEASFIEKARTRYPNLSVLSSGGGSFHKSRVRDHAGTTKGDHALMDCVLLSRCTWVLNCSSALSAFAKVLNPELRIYRVAASKLFGVAPYFPIAYIRRFESSDPACAQILDRQFKDDWSEDPRARRRGSFRTLEISLATRVRRLYRFSRTGIKQQLILRGWIRESARTYI